MELKKEDTNAKVTDEFDENMYGNPSDSVFNGIDLNTPYQTTSIPTAKKSGGTDLIKYIIFGLCLLIVVGVGYNYYKKTNKYNGKYEMTSMSGYGITMTVEDLETLWGTDVYASIEIRGNHCTMVLNYGDIQKDGAVNMKIDGNDITLSDATDTIYGTYDPVEHTISLEADDATMLFEKID